MDLFFSIHLLLLYTSFLHCRNQVACTILNNWVLQNRHGGFIFPLGGQLPALSYNRVSRNKRHVIVVVIKSNVLLVSSYLSICQIAFFEGHLSTEVFQSLSPTVVC